MTSDAQPLLDKIMDLMLDVVCAVNAEGRFVFVSAACEHVFGYTPEELIGRRMIELVHPEDRERTLKTAAEIMRDQPQIHFENRYLRKDGGVVDIMWSARWSEPDGIRLAVGRDVTALKHAARMQRAVYQISEAAHAAEGLPALYRHIHQIIGELLPTHHFLVALYDKSRDMLSFPYVADERGQGREPHALGEDVPLAQVIHTGQALLTFVGENNATAAQASGLSCHDANWLGAPLIALNGVMGAMVVQTGAGDVAYTEEHKALLQFVSTQVATVIERKQTETRLYHMALHDALTDLPNRALFRDRFDVALMRAVRDGERLALLYLDLDDFKSVNDALGHEVGDLLLREVAHRLMQCVRESDTVGRMGGDEFTVLLTNILCAESADLAADKIRAALAMPFELAGKTLAISASIGIAVYPEHGDEGDQLFRHADANMYAAKRR